MTAYVTMGLKPTCQKRKHPVLRSSDNLVEASQVTASRRCAAAPERSASSTSLTCKQRRLATPGSIAA